MPVNCNNDPFFLDKPPFNAVNQTLLTPFGKLRIRGPVKSEEIESLRLSAGLNCFRPAKVQHSALCDLTDAADGMLFTATLANTVISYVSFQKPDFPWWQKRCFPELIELGGIETDPGWRRMGLITALLGSIFCNVSFKYFDDYIVVAIHTIYSWDVKNSSIAPWAYRQMMIDIFKKADFETWETDDPEIREHPCNILLARVGSNINPDTRKHFERCCMGT